MNKAKSEFSELYRKSASNSDLGIFKEFKLRLYICWEAVMMALPVLIVGLATALLSPLTKSMTMSVVIATIIVSSLLLFSIKICYQWERAIILRLGKFHRLAEPGLFFIIPVFEKVAQLVDSRVRSTDFSSESTLTKDTVPVNVDAICFWLVWDSKKAVLEVEDYFQAIVLSAQTALRDVIGGHELADLLTHRGAIGEKLCEVLDEKTNPWGITIQSVEVRDIIIPKALEDAMSKQAQAERERKARVVLSGAETEIAHRYKEAAETYKSVPEAMHLRGMNMLYEGLKEKGSMIIVPSSALDTMNLGTISGLASLSRMNETDENNQLNK